MDKFCCSDLFNQLLTEMYKCSRDRIPTMSRTGILAISLMFLVAMGASAETFGWIGVTGPARAYLDGVGYPAVIGPTRGGWGVFGPG